MSFDQSIQKFYETHPRMAAALKNEFNFMLNEEDEPTSNLTVDDKKKRRLERNRDSAREWLISCAPMFHDSSGALIQEPTQHRDGEVSTLWYSLLETLKPSKEQISTLVKLAKTPISHTSQSSASSLQNQDTITPSEEELHLSVETVSHTSEKMLDCLDELFSSKNDSLDHEMAEIQGILSATQIAKFILWIDQNHACMQLLEALWPHLTEDQDRVRVI